MLHFKTVIALWNLHVYESCHIIIYSRGVVTLHITFRKNKKPLAVYYWNCQLHVLYMNPKFVT